MTPVDTFLLRCSQGDEEALAEVDTLIRAAGHITPSGHLTPQFRILDSADPDTAKPIAPSASADVEFQRGGLVFLASEDIAAGDRIVSDSHGNMTRACGVPLPPRDGTSGTSDAVSLLDTLFAEIAKVNRPISVRDGYTEEVAEHHRAIGAVNVVAGMVAAALGRRDLYDRVLRGIGVKP